MKQVKAIPKLVFDKNFTDKEFKYYDTRGNKESVLMFWRAAFSWRGPLLKIQQTK